MVEKEYSMIYKCRNCFCKFLVWIPFKQEALMNLECLNCGLSAVSATEKTTDFDCVCLLENERLVYK